MLTVMQENPRDYQEQYFFIIGDCGLKSQHLFRCMELEGRRNLAGWVLYALDSYSFVGRLIIEAYFCLPKGLYGLPQCITSICWTESNECSPFWGCAVDTTSGGTVCEQILSQPGALSSFPFLGVSSSLAPSWVWARSHLVVWCLAPCIVFLSVLISAVFL